MVLFAGQRFARTTCRLHKRELLMGVTSPMV